jgi:2-polyprenyl-6-hydroxyphenyl methylase/3-demethylubiquinone-9 3-methyltransferase
MSKPSVEDIWDIMNQLWNDMNLNNSNYTEEELSEYYSHPVWFLNGLFIECDKTSMKHRQSIANYFKDKKNLKIADYGGGFGTLAKEIAKVSPTSSIDIYEPHASEFAYKNIKSFKNINIVDEIKVNEYDALVNTDFLEHVEDPLEYIIQHNKMLKNNGILISHWNFSNVIECHLPKNFHYKYSMDKIIPLLGFSDELINENYGHYFKKEKLVDEEDIKKAYGKAKISKKNYPILKYVSNGKKFLGRFLKNIGIYNFIKRVIKN